MNARPTFWSLGATTYTSRPDGDLDVDFGIRTVPIRRRIEKLPGALLLTAGYYASLVPMLSRALHRAD